MRYKPTVTQSKKYLNYFDGPLCKYSLPSFATSPTLI